MSSRKWLSLAIGIFCITLDLDYVHAQRVPDNVWANEPPAGGSDTGNINNGGGNGDIGNCPNQGCDPLSGICNPNGGRGPAGGKPGGAAGGGQPPGIGNIASQPGVLSENYYPMSAQTHRGSGYRLTDPSALESPLAGFISDPVLADSGEFTFESNDIGFEHDGTYFNVRRIYRHMTPNNRGGADFGENFHTNLHMEVNESNGSLNADVEIGFGQLITFSRPNTSSAFVPDDGWERYRLYRDTVGSDFRYRLVDRNGYTYEFAVGSATPLRVVETYNRFGQGEEYVYDVSDYVQYIKVGGVTKLTITRNMAHAITAIEDFTGRRIEYDYDGDTPAKLEEVLEDGAVEPAVHRPA